MSNKQRAPMKNARVVGDGVQNDAIATLTESGVMRPRRGHRQASFKAVFASQHAPTVNSEV